MRVSVLGFPRIGKNRELKKALESFWRGEISEKELISVANRLKSEHIKIQESKGVDLIPVGDFSLYDSVLDTAVMFSCAGDRFRFSPSQSGLEKYFVYARGNKSNPALEMTKWFDTNYHYIVPEIGNKIELSDNFLLKEVKWAKKRISVAKIKPVLIGPYTFVRLAKIKDAGRRKEALERLLPLYERVIKEVAGEGVKFFQIDEPALVYGRDKSLVRRVGRFYSDVLPQIKGVKFILQTYFESIEEHFAEVVNWPFDYIGLDMVRGLDGNLKALAKNRKALRGKGLVLGIVDGRNIWKADYSMALSVIKLASRYVDEAKIIISPSSSLQFVPYTVEGEDLGAAGQYIAFALEKLDELKQIKSIAANPKAKALKENKALMKRWAKEAFLLDKDVRARMRSLNKDSFTRPLPFKRRYALQNKALNLPKFPTTTIGSFPQTKDVRRMRLLFKRGEISALAYRVFIADKIKEVVKIQEDLGLDMLVHGEFERTDMVEFFGEKMQGFLFTKNGWVQSYGSRCVRPPIIFGDVSRPSAMTVDEVRFAQELTDRPVKGMLTGPITILNWSFPRTDISRKEIAFQIALGLRDEVRDLERAGIKAIQVDEPALREGLPLKGRKHKAYLTWAVDAFRLATSCADAKTQIHTHMCYSDFNDIIESISAMDADVISIENARSRGELLDVFKEFKYDKAIGPGIYDIHSRRVPPVDEMYELLKICIEKGISANLLWVNPDCGLKTRDWPETIAALKNMVAAAKKLRRAY